MSGSKVLSEASVRIRGRAATMRVPVSNFIASCNDREIEVVRRFTCQLQRRTVRPIALVANRLSNGPLFAIIGLLFWLTFGKPGAVAAAAAALALGHVIYPVIKRAYCRRRPFRFDATIPSLLEPLDEHSFPSGHMMSCLAVTMPLCLAVPTLWPVMLGLLVLIGWARLVAGHHYPSDLVAGCALGAAVALPIVTLQLAYG